MKKKLLSITAAVCFLANGINAQVSDLAPTYKVVNIGTGGY